MATKLEVSKDCQALELNHFSNIYKESERENLGEILKVIQYFPRMVEAKDNEALSK
jgi:hypothetical protein